MSTECPLTPPAEFERQATFLAGCRRIAVVGMSPDPARTSHEVGIYLKSRGFEIVPIHPKAETIAGIPVFASLTAAVEAGHQLDLVDLFLNGERNGPIVEEAIRLDLPAIWFQPGTANPEAEERARQAGLTVIANACTMAVWRRRSAQR